MPVSAEYPYNEYYVYVTYHKKDNRRMAHLVKKNTKSKVRTTVSYARYLMSVHLKRFLTKEETVDHINEDSMDDRIENFQLLTMLENKAKSQKKRTMIHYECANCGIPFSRRLNSHRVSTPCCSRSCSVQRQQRRRKLNG